MGLSRIRGTSLGVAIRGNIVYTLGCALESPCLRSCQILRHMRRIVGVHICFFFASGCWPSLEHEMPAKVSPLLSTHQHFPQHVAFQCVVAGTEHDS